MFVIFVTIIIIYITASVLVWFFAIVKLYLTIMIKFIKSSADILLQMTYYQVSAQYDKFSF